MFALLCAHCTFLLAAWHKFRIFILITSSLSLFVIKLLFLDHLLDIFEQNFGKYRKNQLFDGRLNTEHASSGVIKC